MGWLSDTNDADIARIRLFGITIDHTCKGPRGTDFSLMIGWLRLRFPKTNGGVIARIMLFCIVSDQFLDAIASLEIPYIQVTP